MKYELPKLPYEYNALEPFIDSKTMTIHHTKHHQAYVDNLNIVLEKYPQIVDEKLEDLMKKFETLPMDEKDKKMFRNHGETATKHFGSGWAWLVKDASGKLQIYSLPNQDSPYLTNHIPLIGLDVWEHAYYLKYQNRRAEYIDAWWNVLKLL
ncbi:superoxide dismutase [Candidatus Gottesmanbacteria bacterium]|nr:superoxide dismutase [Candidatus Gottesmanbacteria bacterium]